MWSEAESYARWLGYGPDDDPEPEEETQHHEPLDTRSDEAPAESVLDISDVPF